MRTIGRRLERLHEQQGLYISESAKSALSLFGLSEYDVKAYCALLELGPSTASELAIRSLVPYSKIYEVLGGLRKKGWVESYTARPTRFFPVSPGHAFAEARMRFENELKEKQVLAVNELEPFYDRNCRTAKP